MIYLTAKGMMTPCHITGSHFGEFHSLKVNNAKLASMFSWLWASITCWENAVLSVAALNQTAVEIITWGIIYMDVMIALCPDIDAVLANRRG